MTMLRPIRLLVVDDSGFMRLAVRKMVADAPDIQVVAEARNGIAAVQMAQDLRPDVITMDIEMPDMDGMTATRAIMSQCPMPIIMLSSLTQQGAEATIEALSAGAVDFISKSSSFVQLDITQIDRELKEKIRYWGRRPIIPLPGLRAPAARAANAAALRSCDRLARPPELVVIGVSTGGPRTLPGLLKVMGRLNCPVVVAQHMPSLFTSSFALHLRQDTGLDVREGATGLDLPPGSVTVLPGGQDGLIGRGIGGKHVLSIRSGDEAAIHPSADLLFESALRVADGAVAVLLTGMGSDGTRGARKFADRGLPVLVQEPGSCVVGGMPSSAIDAGAVSHILSIEDIARKLSEWAGSPLPRPHEKREKMP